MRVLFGTDGVRGPANKYPLVPETVAQLSRAAAQLLSRKARKAKTMLVGRDTRRSCDMLEYAVVAGICSAGLSALRVGILPTAGVARLAAELGCAGGVMISASHNNAQDNGIKFFDGTGFKLDDLEEEMVEMLMHKDGSETPCNGIEVGVVDYFSEASSRYLDLLKDNAHNEVDLTGMKIVVDCANGAAYQVAPQLFSELGAQVIAINNEPNGCNINANCGALHPEAVAKCVLEEKAEAGIAVDGDADRLALIDEKGNVWDGDLILGVCALDMLANNQLPGRVVVGTEMTNQGLEHALAAQGAQLVRARVGDRYVCEKMLETNAILGGEQSGHIIFLNHSTTADALLASIVVLGIAAKHKKPLSQFREMIPRLPQVLINVPVSEKPEFWEIAPIRQAITQVELKLQPVNGRVVVRYSGTENVARVMVESPTQPLSRECATLIAEAFRKTIGA